MPPAPPSRASTLALALLLTLLQLLAVLNPSVVEIDPEEMVNASQAFELVHGHLLQAFSLQYRDYCGGCTLDAGLGGLLFSVLPPLWIVWKLVPIGWSLLLLVAGHRLLGRQLGAPAAHAFGLILLFSPRAWLHLSLIAWGNHVECGVLAALVVLVLSGPPARGRSLAAGALAGIGLWVGFSGAFAALAGLLVLARRPREAGGFLLGVAVCLLPWGAQWALAATHPFSGIYQPGEGFPSLARLPHKLGNLLHPRQIEAIFGQREGLGRLLGFGWAAAAGVAGLLALREGPRPARLALVFAAAWVAVYSTVRFEMGLPEDGSVAVPGTVRYAAPLFPLLFLLLASVIGAAWASGHRRRALLLAAPILIAGLVARLETFTSPFPAWSALGIGALDHERFREQASWQLPLAVHQTCKDPDPRARALHDYALGRAALEVADRQEGSAAWAQGLGAALIDQLDPTWSGDLALLVEAEIWLQGSGLSATTRDEALRSAAWRRHEAPSPPWAASPLTDPAARAEMEALLAPLPPELHAAVSEALGRDLAGRTTGWLVSGAPPLAPDMNEAFRRGLGDGLGERWGPGSWSRVGDPAFEAGVERGTARRW